MRNRGRRDGRGGIGRGKGGQGVSKVKGRFMYLVTGRTALGISKLTLGDKQYTLISLCNYTCMSHML